MTNFEKYYGAIKEMADADMHIGVHYKYDNPVCCEHFDCTKCKFENYRQTEKCDVAFSKWCCKEYEEKNIINQEELRFITMMKDTGGWLLRDKDRGLAWTQKYPEKGEVTMVHSLETALIKGMFKNMLEFDFIKVEDKPRAILHIIQSSRCIYRTEDGEWLYD